MVNPVDALTERFDATIGSGESITSAINLAGRILCGVYVPAGWTAASLTFQGSYDGTTFMDVYDSSGTEEAASASASRYVAINHINFLGLRFLKVRSGTSASPINQGAERTLVLELGEPET